MTLDLPSDLLAEAGQFLESRGVYGQEGAALFAGPDAGPITRLVVVDQRASTERAAWVEVTDAGRREQALALGPNERYHARIHSHPGRAFHSRTDDANPILTFDGALSIVAPYFGLGLRDGLHSCAVYRLQQGKWARLDAAELDLHLRVV